MTKKKEEKQKKTENKKNAGMFFSQYFGFVLFACVVLVVLVFYYGFLNKAIKKRHLIGENLIEEKQAELENELKVYNELKKLKDVYGEVSPYLKNKTRELLPENPELHELYYNLEQLAEQKGYVVTNITVNVQQNNNVKKKLQANLDESGELQPVQNQKKVLQVVEVDFSVEGKGYLDFVELLKAIENNLRLFDVQSFNYVNGEEEHQFRLKTYFFN